MQSRKFVAALLAAAAVSNCWVGFGQTGSRARYRVDVDMVVLTFEVKDGKGNAVRGLKPADVHIFEDGIPQEISAFAEGSKTTALLADQERIAAGTNVFILFDTSNRMYNAFPYVYDSISDFVRRLDSADSIAIYTFSRNLYRAAPLTSDHALARAGLNNAVAGDDTALFNALLLTLRDATAIPGRKAIVVFSNGPDNASMVSPYDVGTLAEDEGVPIYIISTQIPDKDKTLVEALRSLTERTGGSLYHARNWQQQAMAFRTVREEIESSYTACYYPAPNANAGFRRFRVEIDGPEAKRYVVRTRSGYRSLNPKN